MGLSQLNVGWESWVSMTIIIFCDIMTTLYLFNTFLSSYKKKCFWGGTKRFFVLFPFSHTRTQTDNNLKMLFKGLRPMQKAWGKRAFLLFHFLCNKQTKKLFVRVTLVVLLLALLQSSPVSMFCCFAECCTVYCSTKGQQHYKGLQWR